MKRPLFFVASLLCLIPALVLAGCPGDPPPGPTSPPSIISFTASPSSLPTGGGQVLLSWVEANGTTLTIDNGVGDVSGLSQVFVNVSQSTTYTLTASNQLSSVSAQVTVVVHVPTQPPAILGFTSNPTSLPVGGGAATLSWSVNDATSLFISGIGDVTGKSSIQVPNITQTTSYTLTASNAAGTSPPSTITVTVAVPTNTPVISSFSATSASLPLGGGTVALSWSVSDAASLFIDNGVGSVTGKTSVTVQVTQTTKFTLTATNALGPTTATTTVTVHVPTQAPLISAFSAAPTSLPLGGGSVELSWAVTDATSLFIDNGVNSVTGKTSVTVQVSQTTTFTLTATNALGPTTATAIVTVQQPTDKPVISFFSASPTSLPIGGGNVQLSWLVSDASSIYIDNGVGVVTGKTSATINVTQTTTFNLTATNSLGSRNASATVLVYVPTSWPTINSFTASQSSLPYGGGTVQLSWSVTDASSLSISGVGNVTGQTSTSVNVSQTTTYILTATNSLGSKQATVTVNVTAGSSPVISFFTASPTSITAGGQTLLSWNVSGATSLNISDGIGNVTGLSSQWVTVPTAGTWTFTLSAANNFGTTSATAKVQVTSATPVLPIINYLSASPTTISAGGDTTLSWSVNGATSLSLSYVGNVTGQTSQLVNVPSAGTWAFTLTATNAAGSSSAQVTVVATNPLPARPVINYFSASPTSIGVGDYTTLSWDVSGADTLTINNSVGDVTGYTSQDVYINSSGTWTFTLTATNAGGTTQATVKVFVTGGTSPTISSFTATTYSLYAGDTVTLYWTVSGADTISLDNGIGDVTGYTSQDVIIPTSGTWTFNLSATNAYGTNTAQLTIDAY